jgi:uncharacterized protein
VSDPPPPPEADRPATRDARGAGPAGDESSDATTSGDGPAQVTPGTVIERPGLDERERRLDPAAVTSWRISAALSLVPLMSIATVLGFVFLDTAAWIVAAAALGLLAFVIGWLQQARYKRWRWQLTDLAVELRYGVLVHQQETVPYFRIQQIDIVQGPLDRLLDLATLQVTTASASGSATLPGIARGDAPAVRKELLARATEAVAEHSGDLRDAV